MLGGHGGWVVFGKKWQTPGEGRGREPRVRELKMCGWGKGEQGGGQTRRDRETEGVEISDRRDDPEKERERERKRGG